MNVQDEPGPSCHPRKQRNVRVDAGAKVLLAKVETIQTPQFTWWLQGTDCSGLKHIRCVEIQAFILFFFNIYFAVSGLSYGCVDSLVVAHRLSCSTACGILVPQPETEPVSPALQGGVLTTGPSGKSQNPSLYNGAKNQTLFGYFWRTLGKQFNLWETGIRRERIKFSFCPSCPQYEVSLFFRSILANWWRSYRIRASPCDYL